MAVRNGARDLPAQLGALAAQRFAGRWELVVVDNLSTDATPAVLEAWGDRLPMRVVAASAKPGVAYARNEGARAAQAELLLWCDADDMVDPGWLEGMVRAGQSYDLFGGRLSVDRLNSPELRRLRDSLQEESLPVAHGFLPYAISASIGCRRVVFDTIGGWDERFVRSSDDIDFSWRAQMAGFSIGFAGEALVHYRYRDDRRAYLRQRYEYGRGSVLLLVRHGRPHPGRARLVVKVGRIAVAGPRHLADPVHRLRWVGRLAYTAGQLVAPRRPG